MQRTHGRLGRAPAAAAAALVLLGAAAAAGETPAEALELPVKEYVLSNGLKLLVLPRRHVPQVVCRLTYRVGSVNERPGITGISHILEHMMFKGTQVIGVKDAEKDRVIMERIDALAGEIAAAQATPGHEKLAALKDRFDALRKQQDDNLVPEELWELYRKAGGTDLNAATGNDSTNYYVKLPAGMEELFFWLESDRMAHAVFRQFYPEIGVIREERRQRVEDAPAGRFSEQLNALFFEAHPYRWPIIGYDEDIARVAPRDLAEYFGVYYRPNNAHVTIVGDVDPDACFDLASRYFGRIARGPDVPPPPICSPRGVGEIRVRAEAPAPDRVVVYYHTPPEGHPDSLVMDCASEILNGSAGRLHKALVLKDKLAVRVMAYNFTRTHGGLFGLVALAAPGADLAAVEAALLAQAEGLAKNPPDAAELARAKIQFEAHFVMQLGTLMGTAALIADAEATTSWRDVATYLPRLRRVTAEDIAGGVRKYLGAVRTIGVLTRTKDAAAARP